MRMHEQAMRLKQTEIDAKRRQVEQLEKMIEEFNRMIENLDYDVEAEHRRTRIDDIANVAYSTVARAAVQRRENLEASVADLQRQLKTAEASLDLAEAELAKNQKRANYDSKIAGH